MMLSENRELSLSHLKFVQVIDQFRYIKIQPKIIDHSARLWGITTEFVGFIPQSLVLRSIVLGWILIYRNWSINGDQLFKSVIAKCHGMLAIWHLFSSVFGNDKSRYFAQLRPVTVSLLKRIVLMYTISSTAFPCLWDLNRWLSLKNQCGIRFGFRKTWLKFNFY